MKIEFTKEKHDGHDCIVGRVGKWQMAVVPDHRVSEDRAKELITLRFKELNIIEQGG